MRRLSLRARLTLLVSLGLAVALTVGSVLLVALTRHSLLSTVDSGAQRTGETVAELSVAGRLPDPIPVTGSATVIQVVDDQGRVLQVSATGDHLVPLLDQAEVAVVRSGRTLSVTGDRAGLLTPLRVVGVPAGSRTVIVAVAVDQLRESVRVAVTSVLIGGPILLLALAALTWVVVGLTLRPVGELRRGAEDITGRSLDERLPVRPGRDEIDLLAGTLNTMLDRIDASRRRQRSFVSDAAHELRSPLAAIRTQVEVAQRAGGWEETAVDVLADVERMSRLVDDLLLLARLDEGSTARPRRRAEVRLDELVQDLLPRYAGARVPVSAGALAPAAVLGDPDGLRRVVTNLVDNAVRHARASVVVVTYADGRVEVSDDGPGIPAAERERVFDRFARRDDARSRDAGGSGLGLAIARELARAHGGEVMLSEADSGGLCATVRIPSEQLSS